MTRQLWRACRAISTKHIRLTGTVRHQPTQEDDRYMHNDISAPRGAEQICQEIRYLVAMR